MAWILLGIGIMFSNVVIFLIVAGLLVGVAWAILKFFLGIKRK